MEIGRLLKPHGVKGEIGAELFGDLDLKELRCVIVNEEGIYVPFFIESYRPKSKDTYLIKFDHLDSDLDVAVLSLKEMYALKDDVQEEDENEEGFYVGDLIGYTAVNSDGSVIGSIDDINEDTENTLFIITDPSNRSLLVPAVAEFISGVDIDKKIVELDLPEGLFDL